MEDKNLSHLEGKGAQENSDVLLHCLAYFIVWIYNNYSQSGTVLPPEQTAGDIFARLSWWHSGI